MPDLNKKIISVPVAISGRTSETLKALSGTLQKVLSPHFEVEGNTYLLGSRHYLESVGMNIAGFKFNATGLLYADSPEEMLQFLKRIADYLYSDIFNSKERYSKIVFPSQHEINTLMSGKLQRDILFANGFSIICTADNSGGKLGGTITLADLIGGQEHTPLHQHFNYRSIYETDWVYTESKVIANRDIFPQFNFFKNKLSELFSNNIDSPELIFRHSLTLAQLDLLTNNGLIDQIDIHESYVKLKTPQKALIADLFSNGIDSDELILKKDVNLKKVQALSKQGIPSDIIKLLEEALGIPEELVLIWQQAMTQNINLREPVQFHAAFLFKAMPSEIDSKVTTEWDAHSMLNMLQGVSMPQFLRIKDIMAQLLAPDYIEKGTVFNFGKINASQELVNTSRFDLQNPVEFINYLKQIADKDLANVDSASRYSHMALAKKSDYDKIFSDRREQEYLYDKKVSWFITAYDTTDPLRTILLSDLLDASGQINIPENIKFGYRDPFWPAWASGADVESNLKGSSSPNIAFFYSLTMIEEPGLSRFSMPDLSLGGKAFVLSEPLAHRANDIKQSKIPVLIVDLIESLKQHADGELAHMSLKERYERITLPSIDEYSRLLSSQDEAYAMGAKGVHWVLSAYDNTGAARVIKLEDLLDDKGKIHVPETISFCYRHIGDRSVAISAIYPKYHDYLEILDSQFLLSGMGNSLRLKNDVTVEQISALSKIRTISISEIMPLYTDSWNLIKHLFVNDSNAGTLIYRSDITQPEMAMLAEKRMLKKSDILPEYNKLDRDQQEKVRNLFVNFSREELTFKKNITEDFIFQKAQTNAFGTGPLIYDILFEAIKVVPPELIEILQNSKERIPLELINLLKQAVLSNWHRSFDDEYFKSLRREPFGYFYNIEPNGSPI